MIISSGEYVMSYVSRGPMKNVRKEVIATQWPMGDWGSVLGVGYDDVPAKEMKLIMASSLGGVVLLVNQS